MLLHTKKIPLPPVLEGGHHICTNTAHIHGARGLQPDAIVDAEEHTQGDIESDNKGGLVYFLAT